MLKNNAKKKIKKVIKGLGKAVKAHSKQKKMLKGALHATRNSNKQTT